MDNLRVLAIQSHVVHGYVGNRCVVFPLQHFGIEVDFMNTVEYSNHVHYEHLTGHAYQGKDLTEIFNGLRKNGFHRSYTNVLTGYSANASCLSATYEAIKQFKADNPKLFYLCDPIMGDEGRLYVAADCAEIYRQKLLTLADLITPNQFEMELLTGVHITNEETALLSIKAAHDKGVRFVCLSSMDTDASSSGGASPIRTKSDLANYSLTDDEHPKALLTGYFSVELACENAGRCTIRFRFRVPKVPAYFCGTGDLFAAVLLAHLLTLESKSPSFHAAVRDRVPLNAASLAELSDALAGPLRHTLCAVYAVLRNTLADAKRRVRVDDDTQQLSELLELRVVSCRNQLTSPPNYECITVEQMSSTCE